MSTAVERLEVIKTNYQSALSHELSDKASAGTAALVAQIEANVASAASAYYSATESAMSASAGTVEADFNAAKAANAAVAKAREEVMNIAELLGKLTKATQAADKLVKSATG